MKLKAKRHPFTIVHFGADVFGFQPVDKVGRKRKPKCLDLGLPACKACAYNLKSGKKSKKSCLVKSGALPAPVAPLDLAKRKRKCTDTFTHDPKHVVSMQRAEEVKLRRDPSVSHLLREFNLIDGDVQLGGNRKGRGSALTRFVHGEDVSATELQQIVSFFQLPAGATKDDATSVALVYEFQNARDEFQSARDDPAPVCATPAKSKISSFFKPTSPSPSLQMRSPKTPSCEDGILRHAPIGKSPLATHTKASRKSKHYEAGQNVREILQVAHKARTTHNNATEANAALEAMVKDCNRILQQTTKKDTDKQRVRRTVQAMEGLLLHGNVLWCQKVLVAFNSRPVCVEIKKSAPALFEDAAKGAMSKEERVGAMIVKQLKDFVSILTETKVCVCEPCHITMFRTATLTS